ncbi:sulfotransferase [uncultured Tateyamaria sp.]|uniref:sulfotransferase domain-containing protein n=1 Tax=uncultured Tateyamaria sp. TaxID=455651 RepID=UPI00263A3916|nr:sulfotransferase [uncultured Tateyamaria sp.]
MSDFKLNFLIIGGAKCATTWLQNSLQRSPDITMPDPELHYFSRNYHKGAAWYADQFPRPLGTILGEKSNSYLTDPAAAARIKAHTPDVKLIMQIRNPVERAYSDYCMLYRRGEVDADIAAHLDPARASSERFISDGRYAHHVARFLDLFPAEQFLFLRFDDIQQHPVRQLKCLADHIGHQGVLAAPLRSKVKDKSQAVVPKRLRSFLTPLRPLIDPVRNTRPVTAIRSLVVRPTVHPKLSSDLRRALESYYAPEVETLARVTGLDLERWMTQPSQRMI